MKIIAKKLVFGRTFWTIVIGLYIGVVAGMLGYKAGTNVTETGDPEMVKRAYAVGYCAKGQMEAAQEGGAGFEQLRELLPQAYAWCENELARFEAWVAEQEARNAQEEQQGR